MAKFNELELRQNVTVRGWPGLIIALNGPRIKNARQSVALVNFGGKERCRWIRFQDIDVVEGNHE